MKTTRKTYQMKHKSANLIPHFFSWRNFDNTNSIIAYFKYFPDFFKDVVKILRVVGSSPTLFNNLLIQIIRHSIKSTAVKLYEIKLLSINLQQMINYEMNSSLRFAPCEAREGHFTALHNTRMNPAQISYTLSRIVLQPASSSFCIEHTDIENRTSAKK